MSKKTKVSSPLLVALVLPLVLSACFHDDDDDNDKQTLSYRISLTNLTNHQPLSPLAVVLHNSGYTSWQTGSAATDGLEMLAEGGATTDFLAEADGDTQVLATGTGSGLIMPGASDMVDITTSSDGANQLQLSLATMLVNTNDAFTGVAGHSLNGLGVGESQQFYAHAYDAGTEANTETAATIPGPAGGGEGYNSARDDVDFVTIHSGVVSADDGLSASALDESYRFNGPVAMITVTRMQ